VRPRALEPEHVAPVVEHLPLGAGSDEQQQRRRILRAGVGRGRQHRLPHVERRPRHAGGERDLAVDLPAVLGLGGLADGSRHRGTAEIAAGEDLVLRLLRPPRADHQRVVHGQPEAPGGGHAPARDLLHDPHVGGHVELVAAIAARDVQVVEARVEERVVHLRRVVRALLGRRLIADQPRAERDRPSDHLVPGQARLRWLAPGPDRPSTAHRADRKPGSPTGLCNARTIAWATAPAPAAPMTIV
jgi:hypothetical protein